jgi:hypothetical protein
VDPLTNDCILHYIDHVRFEVSTAMTMKNGVFWDVTPRGSCSNRRFGRNASLGISSQPASVASYS